MNDGIRHLLEYATEQRAIGREATSAELHSIAEVIDCEMRNLKDERDHWMELAHQWEEGASTRRFAERLEAAAAERADVTLFGVDYTALPEDAEGVPIHVGDVMENIVCPPVHREVTGVGVECFYGWDEGNGRYSQFDVACYRHHHAPTVEDVLAEFAERWHEGKTSDRCYDFDATLAEYAAKLRLAEGGDE